MTVGGYHTYSSGTCHIVTGQDFIVMAQTENVAGILISSAALCSTVIAVQLHLDLTLSMTLHRWRKMHINKRT